MRTRRLRIDPVLVQAVIAAALSFAHLHDLASAAGQDGWKAWAYPVSVDLLLVAAWRRLRSGEAKAAGWCWFLVALDRLAGRQCRHRRAARPRATSRPGSASSSPDGPRLPSSAEPSSPTAPRHRRTRSGGGAARVRPDHAQLPNYRPCAARRRPATGRTALHPPLSRPRSSPSLARSPTNTAPGPGPPSTPRPFAPASASRCRSPKPSPPNSPDPGGLSTLRPSTLRALKRAAELTRQNRLTEAVLIAEPVILTADELRGRRDPALAGRPRHRLHRRDPRRPQRPRQPEGAPLMPANRRFRNVVRIGPVQVATVLRRPRPREAHRRLHGSALRLLHGLRQPRRRRTRRPHPPLPRPLTAEELP